MNSCDEILVNTSRLPEYFRDVGGRDATSMTENIFSWGNGKPGSSFFEIISQDPRRIKQFDIAMSTQDSTLPVLGMYPFGEELADAPDLENRAALVDIGGGRGQSLLQIKQKWPQLQGRLILQDRSMVLDSFSDLPGIEKMPHDFFTEQPVKRKFGPLNLLYESISDGKSRRSCILHPPLPAQLDRRALRQNPQGNRPSHGARLARSHR
jgi:hypothetical protein